MSDERAANKYLSDFSRLMRAVMENSKHNFVSLASEVQIPPMLIQPYIENAVWHGLRYRETKGKLNVKISNGDIIKVLIEDDGIGRKKSAELKTKNQKETVSTGLKNINNRIKIINEIHGTNLKVNIEDLGNEKGTDTRVMIQMVLRNA